MGNKDKETRERAFRDRKEVLTEWTCHYCPEVATTIRQGAAVCWQHAISLRGSGGRRRMAASSGMPFAYTSLPGSSARVVPLPKLYGFLGSSAVPLYLTSESRGWLNGAMP